MEKLKIPFYQIDAFAAEPFQGNPAAICILQKWLDDKTLQNIAAENNLAETSYMIAQPDGYAIRWFTSLGEINLCGHATLASAHVAFEHLNFPHSKIKFTTREVGDLFVTRQNHNSIMDSPAWMPGPEPDCLPDAVKGLGGIASESTHSARDYMLVYKDAETIRNIRPDFRILAGLGKLICITAPGEDCDFVSRFFCPGDSVEEDPATGSAHCMLAPYWAQRLNKPQLIARQFSPRGTAEILCHVKGDRVELSGRAVTVIEGIMTLPLRPGAKTLHSPGAPSH